MRTNAKLGREKQSEMRATVLVCRKLFEGTSEGLTGPAEMGGEVKIAYGTDWGMFPFRHGIFEFQAMVQAGLSPVRALKAATSAAAEPRRLKLFQEFQALKKMDASVSILKQRTKNGSPG